MPFGSDRNQHSMSAPTRHQCCPQDISTVQQGISTERTIGPVGAGNKVQARGSFNKASVLPCRASVQDTCPLDLPALQLPVPSWVAHKESIAQAS